MNMRAIKWSYVDEQGLPRLVIQYIIDLGYTEMWSEFHLYEDTGQFIYRRYSTHMYD
jgi:hypothetical protein